MWAAVVLAFIGVLVLVVNTGKLPMVSLGLALSFGFYGLIKVREQPSLYLRWLGETFPCSNRKKMILEKRK